MRILILGAAGFIGTNLTLKLLEEKDVQLTLFDKDFSDISLLQKETEGKKIKMIKGNFDIDSDFDFLAKNQDVVYHLISSTVPATSNINISAEITHNVSLTAKLLDACVKNLVKKVIFLSSGGAVYGKDDKVPVCENALTNPISSYGIQKITIEKLLYLYYYTSGLDYRIIRLSNPYGPYQRPNGIQGAVTTFTYKALKQEPVAVYGDGAVVRDFIYIDNAIEGIINISNSISKHKLFNLGCGYGTSLNEILNIIRKVLNREIDITYMQGRTVDVPINYLDINLYEKTFGKLQLINIYDGIEKTAEFLKDNYL